VSGRKPIEDFFDQLPAKTAQKVTWVLKLVEDLEHVPLKYLKRRKKDYFRRKKMSDLQKYIKKRKSRDPKFAENFDSGYKQFKIGAILKQAREEAGLTQEALAAKLNTKKSAISRIENHAEDIKLSTLERFANALGKELRLEVA
jgi:ribosome-binding protein aMBF1 (putative translation factor)